MELERVQAILKNKEKCNIFYNQEPVWIQDLNNNIATIGYIYDNVEKDVYIKDLYERNI